MTTFAELVTATIAVTKRPELVAQTNAAVALAVMRAHHVDFFPRDKAHSVITYTPAATLQYSAIADIYTLYPRLRSIDFIQMLDVSSLRVMETLEVWNQKAILDEYHQTKFGVFSHIGTEVRLYSYYKTGKADIFYVQNPITSSLGFSSWIADLHIEELAQWAAAILFSRTGFLEQASTISQLHVMPFKALLRQSYLLSEVH